MVGVALEFLEVEIRVIVKALASRLVELGVQRFSFQPAAPAIVLGEDLCLGGRQHAVEPSQDGHGEHHALVLRRAVRAPQQVGDLPDQVRKVVVVRHRSSLAPMNLVLRIAVTAHQQHATAYFHISLNRGRAPAR